MMAELSVGQRRWETRRAKYGPAGHAGSYSRFPRAERGALKLVVQLLNEGVLSEGQVCQATGLDRVDVRRLADEAAP
jgi:hypothetical protein